MRRASSSSAVCRRKLDDAILRGVVIRLEVMLVDVCTGEGGTADGRYRVVLISKVGDVGVVGSLAVVGRCEVRRLEASLNGNGDSLCFW
jgi:hypothetical protein